LSAACYWVSGCANGTTAGYSNLGTAITTSADKFSFSDDSRSTLTSTLNDTSYPAGASDNGVAAYFGGGYSGALSTSVRKIAYSDDSSSTLAKTFANYRGAAGGMANSAA
jgi:hypothetical protein